MALLENACGRVYSTRRQNRIVPESVSYHSPPSFFRDNGHPEDEFLFFREFAKQNRLLNKINAFLFGLSWLLFCFQNSDILQCLVVRTEVRCCWTGQCVCSTLTDSDSFQSECANLHTQPEGMKGRILYTFPTKQGFFFKERVQLWLSGVYSLQCAYINPDAVDCCPGGCVVEPTASVLHIYTASFWIP